MNPRSHPRNRTLLAAFAALCLVAGCASLPSPLLVEAGDQPALYLSSEPSAAQIGFLSERVPLQIMGRVRAGRVPVRVDGALRTRGFVDAASLALRVQRRGRVRGTPLYVGPGDVVLVTGSQGSRLTVRAQARRNGKPFGASFEGTYPRVGLAAESAPADAQAPDRGSVYTVPPHTAVPLFEAPRGRAVAELPASEQAYTVEVLNRQGEWLAVRAGEGPYLIGWTSAALTPASDPLARAVSAESSVAPAAEGELPAWLAHEPGALKRVGAGTKVLFGEQVIGVLKRDGYARIVRTFEEAGYVDAFVAADDDVAVRGLVRAIDLHELVQPTLSGTTTPVAAR